VSASTWWFSRSSIGRHVTGISPAEHQGSDEVGRFDEQNRQAADAWKRLHALRADSDIATDYVVVAE
jgi:hypothetical protein